MMNDTLDGTSPAFPCDWICADSMGQQVVREQYSGMTLRDYFAGQVAGHVFHQLIETGSKYEPYMVASDAYSIADAMIKAREVKP